MPTLRIIYKRLKSIYRRVTQDRKTCKLSKYVRPDVARKSRHEFPLTSGELDKERQRRAISLNRSYVGSFKIYDMRANTRANIGCDTADSPVGKI